jgi:hypothetical protein
MNEQKELTKAELQIMQVLWQKENAFVNEILQDHRQRAAPCVLLSPQITGNSLHLS